MRFRSGISVIRPRMFSTRADFSQQGWRLRLQLLHAFFISLTKMLLAEGFRLSLDMSLVLAIASRASLYGCSPFSLRSRWRSCGYGYDMDVSLQLRAWPWIGWNNRAPLANLSFGASRHPTQSEVGQRFQGQKGWQGTLYVNQLRFARKTRHARVAARHRPPSSSPISKAAPRSGSVIATLWPPPSIEACCPAQAGDRVSSRGALQSGR